MGGGSSVLAAIKVGSLRVVRQGLLQRHVVRRIVSVEHHAALLPLGHVVASADRGQQVDNEGEDVSGEDEGNDPFEDGTGILLRLVVASHADTEPDGEADFDNDEAELDDEAGQQDAVLGAIEDTQSKVLGADQDGTDNISNTTHIY